MPNLLKERGGSVDPSWQKIGTEDVMEAEIDRDVDGSFPASDPPGWTMGTESGYDARETAGPCETPLTVAEAMEQPVAGEHVPLKGASKPR